MNFFLMWYGLFLSSQIVYYRVLQNIVPPLQQNWAISQHKLLYFWKIYLDTILYAKNQNIWIIGWFPSLLLKGDGQTSFTEQILVIFSSLGRDNCE